MVINTPNVTYLGYNITLTRNLHSITSHQYQILHQNKFPAPEQIKQDNTPFLLRPIFQGDKTEVYNSGMTPRVQELVCDLEQCITHHNLHGDK